jgi:DNA polymerase-1
MINTPLSVENANGEKELTGAVFAFSNMLLKVWKDEQPDYIAVAFDVGKTFRDDLYADYKGTREKMPDELNAQMKRIQHVVNAFEIPIFTAEGFEADDVLGTLARRASGEGMRVVIVTGDRDALQLVSPAVSVLTSRQRFDDVIVYDEAKVIENYGVQPRQIIDYKAMIGDTSDNVPGVKGIGEKTAQSLLQQFGSLDAIYARLDDIPQKRARTALEAGRDSAFLSKQLVTIKTDLPLEVNWDACAAQFDAQRVVTLFRELRFESLIKRLPPAPGAQVEQKPKDDAGQLSMFGEAAPIPEIKTALFMTDVPTKTRIVQSDDDYKALLAELHSATRIAFDTETTAPDAIQSEMVGLSLCAKEGEAWYVPVLLPAPTEGAEAGGEGWHIDPASPKFEPIANALRRKDVELVGHNAKFDLEVLQQAGAPIDRPVFDTMIAQFLCDPGGRGLGLKQLAFDYFGWQMTEITELIGRGKSQITMREVPVALAAPYAGADADATFRLRDALLPILQQRNQEALFREIEQPLIPVLIDMESTGVALDVKYLGELGGGISARMRELEQQIYTLAGGTFNINSTKQLSDVLFGKLGLPTQGSWKTAGGGYSTNADVLDELRDKHEIVPLMARMSMRCRN